MACLQLPRWDSCRPSSPKGHTAINSDPQEALHTSKVAGSPGILRTLMKLSTTTSLAGIRGPTSTAITPSSTQGGILMRPSHSHTFSRPHLRHLGHIGLGQGAHRAGKQHSRQHTAHKGMARRGGPILLQGTQTGGNLRLTAFRRALRAPGALAQGLSRATSRAMTALWCVWGPQSHPSPASA